MRRTGDRQLSFALADSPQGGGETGAPDVSGVRAFLPHRAKRRPTARTVAWRATARRQGSTGCQADTPIQRAVRVARKYGSVRGAGEQSLRLLDQSRVRGVTLDCFGAKKAPRNDGL